MSAGSVNAKFGGAWWDTLFLFVRDNDEKFIRDFVGRMPCPKCSNEFYKKLEGISLEGDVWTIRRKLWSIRCLIHAVKYAGKDTDKDYNDYLNFLMINKMF
tara:strand:+ start:2281 stop:2583 length:303 start_codon:yes stop_codon:yes gene_type:complete